MFSIISSFLQIIITIPLVRTMHVLLQLALDYKVNGNKQSLEDYLLAIDYMRDQGWAYGSSMGTIDHELLRHAGY